MCKGKNLKMIVAVLLAVSLIASFVIIPFQGVLADDTSGEQLVKKGNYFELPEPVEKYVSSGKLLEFDLNILISASDNRQIRFCDSSKNYVSNQFYLRDGENGLSMSVEAVSGGWYHYSVSLKTVPHTADQENSTFSQFRILNTFPENTKIKNISTGVDIRALPEAFTEDYDTVTLADLGMAGTDYETSVSSGTYTYKGNSETKSVIVKFGWESKLTLGSDKPDWKIALDTYWNEKCMVWFRGDGIFSFIPSDKPNIKTEAITSGKHDVEFGRLRVTAGPNFGKDYVFLIIDGKTVTSVYTDYFQTDGGYQAYSGKIVSPSYTVCFVNEDVSKQGFSGFAKPDEYVSDIDYVNIKNIVPGGVVKDTVHDSFLGYTYPFTSTSATHSTVVKFVIKTGQLADGVLDGSVMVVDIGGNCGFCRSYIPAGKKESFMFGWEIDGCTSGTKKYAFESNSWYACEQGRLRVVDGINKGKDYVYFKINGEIVSYFYGNPDSRPFLGENIYIEATDNIQIVGYNELHAKYYVDDEIYLDSLAQKGFGIDKPEDPKKDGQYFVGWYTEKNGGELFDFNNTKLTDDIYLYAHFTTETVKATFKSNNGNLIAEITSGKNCLVNEPTTPAYIGSSLYEQVFVGWKNETTGEIFDFENGRLSANTSFKAQYKEKEYFVSYYASGKLIEKVPFLLSNPTVAGKEPDVPKIPNTTGVWESHVNEGLTRSITVNAVYKVNTPSSSNSIKLSGYSGNKIYLNTDTIHDYLSIDTPENQTAFAREYFAVPHTYQDHQNTLFKWSDSGKNNVYTVYFADNQEFKNPYIITASGKSLSNEVGIFVPGKTYYWFVYGNDTGKCSAVDSFTVLNTPVRYITAGKVTNMRDLGGYETKDGDKVKYGLVYRGASLDEYHSHIDDTARNVFNYLGIESEIELRGGNDHDYTGWDDNNPNVYYVEANAYESMLSLNDSKKLQYKQTFEAMADKNNYPFYFHCSAGADRTGAFAYLFNGLLGVPYENLRKDYELTTFSEIGLRPADNFSDGSFDNMSRLMLEQYGGGSQNLQVAIQNYLTDYIGVSAAAIQGIKDIMLEKNAVPNDKPHTLTVKVLDKEYQYQVFDGVYFMPEEPKAMGMLFVGFYGNSGKYTGYANKDLTLTARFEDIEYEPYDKISLKDLGVEDEKILNETNTVYTYNKTSENGGRLLQFTLEPIGNLNNNDGPQIALTNDWSQNNHARAWFQSNTMSYFYYKGADGPPDLSKMLSLESGKQYDIEFAVRVMKNEGYEGEKIFEVSVNGELAVQYIGCEADLSQNIIYFHGSSGSAYLINKTVYQTVEFYNGNTLVDTREVERGALLPSVKGPESKNGVPFAGWSVTEAGEKLWNEETDIVYSDLKLYAIFAYVRTITVDVLGEKKTYKVFDGIYFMPDTPPNVIGKFFKGFYDGDNKFDGYAKSDLNLVATYENILYEPYDTITLKDLGIEKDKILNQTNTVYTYKKLAESGGRLFQFVLEPVGDMSGGDGPQIALTNDWSKISNARVWFQSNKTSHFYYKGVDGPPDLSKELALESGKQYDIEFAVRVMKNKGYEGKKIFEISVNGELMLQYVGCEADLSGNVIYFHGGTGAVYLINKPVYKTVNFFDGNTLIGSYQVERGGLLPNVKEPSPKNGVPFAGWYTEKSGGRCWDVNADCVYDNMSLYAHFANVKVITADVDGKILTYRVEVGKTLDEIPKPQKQGYVFKGWTVNGKLFTGKVTANMKITALFEAYSFDDYDEISLRDLGIYNDFECSMLGSTNHAKYTYRKAAKTGGRVFKAVYVPTENMINGPQVSFSEKWDENYFAKLYFTKFDKLYVYSSGVVDGLPTLAKDYDLVGGKEYEFEIGVRVLNNKGYKGVKVLTVYINDELIFEEFNNKANIEGDTVFFQGLPDTGVFRNIDIYKTVSFYEGDKLLSSAKILRGQLVKSIGNLADKADKLFMGWFTEYGIKWDFDIDCVYLDTVLKAKFQKRTYPVLLMVDDVLYKRLDISAGECLDSSDIPIKDGYEFEKWLCGDGSDYNMQTPVNAPVTLFASFKVLPPAEVTPMSTKTDNLPVEKKEEKSSDLKYVLFGVIGLAVIATEIGALISKKRSKQ